MNALSRRQLAGLVLLTLIWGVNWPIMKLSLSELAPIHFRALTMGLGALVMAAYFGARGLRMVPRGRAEWCDVLVLGLPNVLGWQALSIIGVAHLAAGRAAILGFTVPVWTVLLSVLFYGERLTGRLVVGIAAVLVSIVLLLWNEVGQLAAQSAGILWMQGGALCMALGTIWLQRARLTLPTQALVAWMMLWSAAALAVLAAWVEPPQRWSFSAPVWASLTWAVLINYGAAQAIWFALARALPPATSAMSLMAVPMVGVLSAPLIVGEWPSWQDLAAMVSVAVAIGAVLLRRA